MKDLCTLITFGLAGHGEDYASRKPGERMGHLSGYDNPANWKPDRANTTYKGAMVIDKRFPLEANESLAYRPLWQLTLRNLHTIQTVPALLTWSLWRRLWSGGATRAQGSDR